MKKTLLTFGAAALLASPSIFAAENSLQEHLRIQEKLEKHERLHKEASGKHQYKYQHKNQYKYKGTNPNRSNTGSMNGSRMGGGRH